jgi:hypothetical protein
MTEAQPPSPPQGVRILPRARRSPRWRLLLLVVVAWIVAALGWWWGGP